VALEDFEGGVHVGQLLLLGFGLPVDLVVTDLGLDLGPPKAVDPLLEVSDRDLDLLALHVHAAEDAVDLRLDLVLGDLHASPTPVDASHDQRHAHHHRYHDSAHKSLLCENGKVKDQRPMPAETKRWQSELHSDHSPSQGQELAMSWHGFNPVSQPLAALRSRLCPCSAGFKSVSQPV
jgi:hypothetical protein